MTAVKVQEAEGPTTTPWRLGVSARLFLAFFGISALAIVGAVAGNYAFLQVGERLELIDARVPQVASSMEISRAASRLMASTPALLAAATTEQREEIATRMRPEIDHLSAGLEAVKRAGSTGGAAAAIEPLVASFRSNLAELENLVGLRLKTKERLAAQLQAAFQADRDTERLFAPWFQVMEMQINQVFQDSRTRGVEPGNQAMNNLAASVALERTAQTAQRGFSAVVRRLAQTATAGEKSHLPVVAFELSRGLNDLEADATHLDPKLRALFIDEVVRVRHLAIGPDAILDVRRKEFDLIDRAEELVRENADLSAQLDAAVNRLVSETESDIASSTVDAISVQRFSAQSLLVLAALSLIGSALIVWLYVGRNLIRRLMHLSHGMLAIAAGNHNQPIDIAGTDEVAEMGRVVEILRKNTLERDTLLVERAQAADRLERQVEERTAELAQLVEELRALGQVTQAVNSTVDLETVLSTIVAKATQLSNTEAGAIYVFDDDRQEFRLRATYGLPDAIVAQLRGSHIRLGQTALSEAVERRTPIQIPDIQEDPSVTLDIIVRAGFRALLYVPLLGTEKIVGALVVRRMRAGEFPRRTIELLQTFAAQSVLAIQNARLFNEIEEKSRELAVASQHKSQFLANMSHELRTPLNAILGYTELIADGIYGPPTEKMLEVLKRLESNGRHLLGLINEVLDLSKIEAGQFTLDLGDYSLADVANTVYAAVESLAADKKLAFAVDVPADLPTGHGDGRRLTQVLLNLVGNAIKFTDVGQVRIAASKQDGAFLLSVIDTGPGISVADQAKLFQEFQQVDNSITRQKGGTGLGLAISRRIVEMHGGRIWIESTVGRGSTFCVMLPVRAGQPVRDLEAARV